MSVRLPPSSLVFGSQWFAANLLTFVVVLLWWFWVGLHVSAVETGEREQEKRFLSEHRQTIHTIHRKRGYGTTSLPSSLGCQNMVTTSP